MQTKSYLKKLGVLVLALLLTLNLFVGCASETDKESAETPAEKTSETPVETETESDMVGNMYKEGLPIVEEKVTYKLAAQLPSIVKKDINDFVMWEEMEKETNVHFELEAIADSAWNEKLNLMAASNSLADLTIGKVANEFANKAHTGGVILGIKELCETYSPVYKEYFSDKITATNFESPDGEIYFFPYGESAPWMALRYQSYINQDWLDAVGMEIPTTLDEYTEVLKAFRDQDPNGNGKKDEIPLTMICKTNGQNDIGFIMNYFGMPMENAHDYYYVQDGEFEFAPIDNAFKDGLAYLNMLYTENLLDKELFTQEKQAVDSKARQEDQLLGSFSVFWPRAFLGSEKTDNYSLMMPLKGYADYDEVFTYSTINTKGVFISKNAENPEILVRWLDYTNANIHNKAEIWGGPSSHYDYLEWLDNGKYFFNSEVDTGDMNFTEFKKNNSIWSMSPVFFTAKEVEENREVDGLAGYKLGLMNEYSDYFQKPENMITAGTFSSLGEEEMENVNILKNSLTPLIDTFVAKSVIEGVDEDSWAKFQKDLEKAGVAEYMGLMQKSLDNYMGKIK